MPMRAFIGGAKSAAMEEELPPVTACCTACPSACSDWEHRAACFVCREREGGGEREIGRERLGDREREKKREKERERERERKRKRERDREREFVGV